MTSENLKARNRKKSNCKSITNPVARLTYILKDTNHHFFSETKNIPVGSLTVQ